MARFQATSNSPSRDSGNTSVEPLSVALAAVPFLAIALLYLFAWHTSRVYGQWPSYAQPDPTDANTTLYWLSGIALLAALPAVATHAFATVAMRPLRQSRSNLFALLIGIVGLALLWSAFAGDLGDWYMD